jgi:UDP-N-acetylglucosamine:LPS N-acetylglucosamine transferase
LQTQNNSNELPLPFENETTFVGTDGASSSVTSERRVLLVSSSGGHWVQLRRLRPAFEGWRLYYACTDAGYRSTVDPGERFYGVPEATRWTKFRLIAQAWTVFWVLLRTRPEVVVSTGASPGFFAMLFGRLLRRKTIWVDSIANVDEMSLSGQQARRFTDLWLTQWEHLARPEGPGYFGSLV